MARCSLSLALGAASPRVRIPDPLVSLGVGYAAIKRPDVLHIHAVGPALVTPLARALGLRVVVTHHGPDYDRQKWGVFAKGILRLGERLGMKTANERVVISAGIRDLVQSRYGVDSNLIPNGVDLATGGATTETLERFGLVAEKYVIQVSRLVPEKRQLDLIAAFKLAKLPGWKLVLVGDTEFPDDYSRSVKDSALHDSSVVCAGFQTGRALHELYAHAGVFVLPSSHSRALPIALLEALSYGLKTLASNIPANLEVGLPDGSYFQLGDIEGLAGLLRREAATPSTTEEKASRVARAALYDWNAIARTTLMVYQRAVAR